MTNGFLALHAHTGSASDATYLQLAARENVPLAPLDEALAAARAANIALGTGEPRKPLRDEPLPKQPAHHRAWHQPR